MTKMGKRARALKRAADLAVAGAGLAATWPAIVAIGALVKLDSDGPVFHRGVRAGIGGKPFKIFKFRTMVKNAEKVGGTTTADRDPRITRVGAILRKYKLDELPQLFNVLDGSMSLVGPRPEVFEYVDAYTEEERIILTVKPGITDYASIEFNDLASVVGGDDADAAFREHVLGKKNRLRMRYVEEQSLANDLKIIFDTARVLLRTRVKGHS